MYVGAEGPKNAKLAFVGMKGGRDEVAQGRPFVGATGQMLMRYLARCGLRREDVYLTNAIHNFSHHNDPSDAELRAEQPRLFRELCSLPNLNCIVPLGNHALVSLSNFHYNDITHRRGSKLLSFIRKKMLPTFHPSYVIQGNWEMSPVVEFDIARAKKEAEFPDIKRPDRTYFVLPTFSEATDWLHHLEKGEWLSFDIETRKAGPHMNWFPTTIAFSSDPREGFCIPFARQDRTPYWTPSEEAILWKRIQRLLTLEDKCYVTQNGLFDTWHLYRNGIVCPHMAKGFDTMYAHRYLAADLPHALDFLVSIYTEEEYYKDESGKHESEVRVGDEQFQVYNAKDAAITLEVAHTMIEDMKELNMYEYYMAHKQSQWDVLFDMRRRGFRVDKKKKAILTSKFEGLIIQAEDEIRAELGWVPNTKSPIDMMRVFDKFGIRPQMTEKTEKAKITEEKLLSYAHRWPAAQPVIANCLSITQQRTLLNMFMRLTTDPANFYHASYDLSKAKTGRLASEGADEGHLLKPKKKAGPQMQNIPRSLRAMFVPDSEEDELTNFDFTQAEPHVVAWDAGDDFYIKALLSGKDVHRIAACVIFRNYDISLGLPPDTLINSIPKICAKCLEAGEQECTHSERYLAKRCKNGFSYKMGARKLCIVLRGDNIFMDERKAREIEYRVITPALRAWWDLTMYELKNSRWLTNIYGTKKEFFGLINEDALREALSWKAQSAVTHLTCHAMRYLFDSFSKTKLPASIKTQTHDSITINHRKKDRAEVVDLIQKATYLPAMVHGRELIIPHEVTHGPSWGEQYKPSEWAKIGLKWVA